MNFAGWAKSTRRAAKRVATLLYVGAVHSKPRGISLMFTTDRARTSGELDKLRFELSEIEWRELVRQVEETLEISRLSPFRSHDGRAVCPDRTDGGPHEYTPDTEYDSTGQTVNCLHCGDEPPVGVR